MARELHGLTIRAHTWQAGDAPGSGGEAASEGAADAGGGSPPKRSKPDDGVSAISGRNEPKVPLVSALPPPSTDAASSVLPPPLQGPIPTQGVVQARLPPMLGVWFVLWCCCWRRCCCVCCCC